MQRVVLKVQSLDKAAFPHLLNRGICTCNKRSKWLCRPLECGENSCKVSSNISEEKTRVEFPGTQRRVISDHLAPIFLHSSPWTVWCHQSSASVSPGADAPSGFESWLSGQEAENSKCCQPLAEALPCGQSCPGTPMWASCLLERLGAPASARLLFQPFQQVWSSYILCLSQQSRFL